MRILAHRGASGYAPENTQAAFELACSMGAAVIETDVRLTRDGVAVLIHDQRVDRTTSGSGEVAELDWAQIARLDAGSWFGSAYAGQPVPRLDAFLERYGQRVGLCIEVKTEAALPAVVDSVRQMGLSRFVSLEFTSFEWDVVTKLRETFASVPVGLLVRRNDTTIEVARRAVGAGLEMIGPSAANVTREFVEAAHELGMQVRTWGVRSRDDFTHVIACGADGTTLNWPDWTAQLDVQGIRD